MIKAVLFDFDGVVVQSEPLHMRTFMEILSPYRVDVPIDRWYREFAGTGSQSIFERLLHEYGISGDITALVERRKALYERYVKEGLLEKTPGVDRFLSSLQGAGIKAAIVSGSHRTNVELALSLFGLRGYFDLIVSGDDMLLRKPDPGPFLHAAEKMAEKPSLCAVIEDSVAGCESARRAGMKLIVMKSPALPEIGRYDLLIRDFNSIGIKELKSL